MWGFIRETISTSCVAGRGHPTVLWGIRGSQRPIRLEASLLACLPNPPISGGSEPPDSRTLTYHSKGTVSKELWALVCFPCSTAFPMFLNPVSHTIVSANNLSKMFLKT
jgi:hypothetical protein